MRELTAFTIKKYKFLSHPVEDVFNYFCQGGRIFISVADGITRDPIGVRKFPSQANILGWIKFFGSLPVSRRWKKVDKIRE
ncbi:MAG: hypothetical protein H8D34_00205 [Chloroflexi bacterium]|nr:hypothetical protein [Chloroflexota bacterium]